MVARPSSTAAPPLLIVEDLIDAGWGAIDWSGQDRLIEVLLLDPVRGDSTAHPEARALVQRVLRYVA